MSIIIDDNKIINIAKEYATPFYLYSREAMSANSLSLKAAIYPGAKLCYAMKANPLMGIIECFREDGLGIEVASAGEMRVALEAGYKGEDIIFTSPGKTEYEIEYALNNGIKIINIESLAEAELINRIAGEKNVTASIGIRVNPSVCYSNAKIKMSGVSSQFGIEEDLLNSTFFENINSLDNISIKGIQVYMGTQMLNFEDIVKNTEYAIELAIRLSDKNGFELKYLNCGGGFGVKYFKNEAELDIESLKKGMAEIQGRFADRLSDTEIIFESGRFLMATAGLMVTRVLYLKESKGQKYLVCDGGSNIHSSAAFLGRFVRNNFPLYLLRGEGELTETTVCGPLCTALDVIGQKVMIPKDVTIGDLVVIEQSGAYGYTYSPNRFLSHEAPMELLLDGDDVRILRDRGSIEDYLLGQRSIKDK